MRVTPEEYAQIDLRAHSLLADVPLHDVWAVELSGGAPGRTIVDVRRLLSLENLAAANAAITVESRARSGVHAICAPDATNLCCDEKKASSSSNDLSHHHRNPARAADPSLGSAS